jgi:cytidine deaminase
MPIDQARAQILTAAAAKAASRAYAPYSRFQVGAALLFDDGAIVTGANVENASYGLSCCAERNALFRAVSEHGPSRKIDAAAVFHDGPEACPPCGACLQVMSEFASDDCVVYFSHGSEFRSASLDELLPMRFNKDQLVNQEEANPSLRAG